MEYIVTLRTELNKIPIMVQAEKKTGAPKEYLAIGLAAILFLFLGLGWFASLLCNLVGVVYPAYKSFKAIESSRTDDDTQWLTYWVVFGTFSTIDYFADFILSWFPFYFLVKTGLFLYLMLPQFNGATTIYKSLVRPFLVKHEERIDATIDATKAKIAEAVTDSSKTHAE